MENKPDNHYDNMLQLAEEIKENITIANMSTEDKLYTTILDILEKAEDENNHNKLNKGFRNAWLNESSHKLFELTNQSLLNIIKKKEREEEAKQDH